MATATLSAGTRESDQVSHRAFCTDTISPNKQRDNKRSAGSSQATAVSAKKQKYPISRSSEPLTDSRPKPLQVDHKDGNRSNNAVENLRWLTHGENIRASYLVNKSRKSCAPALQKPVRCVETGKRYPHAQAAAAELGVRKTSVNKVASGHRKTIKGFRFEYCNPPDLPGEEWKRL